MVKTHVISGFLGAGKTTLIKKMLEYYKNEKVIVLENEFGEVGIDGELIKNHGFDVIELKNGCICCSIKLNFKEELTNIIEKFNPNRIIIEPTGIGMLSEIIKVLNKPDIKEKCSINSLVTIIDSINYFDYLETFGEFYQDQIENASTIILSKTQFVDKSTLDNIITSLKEFNSRAYVFKNCWDDLSVPELLLTIEDKLFLDIDHRNIIDKKIVNKIIESISFNIYKNLKKDNIVEILKNLSQGHFGKIIRVKGFVNSDEGVIEFNYINGKFTLNLVNLEIEGKACIIGENLQKENIISLFK